MMDDAMFDKIYEMKATSKQFLREANKCEANRKKYEMRIKGLLQKNDIDGAKIAAQQAISYKNQAVRMNTLGHKVGTIATKLQGAARTMAMSSTLKNLVASMPQFATIEQSANAMETLDNFEKMVDNIDVHTTMMNGVFDNMTDTASNEEEVNSLINAIAQGNALKMEDGFVDASGNRVVQQNQIQNSNYNMNYMNHA